MMNPKIFDEKLTELQDIERRMQTYGKRTRISKVIAEHDAAQKIYGQLITALNEYRTISTKDHG